jgi:predicted small secreted protein
MKANWSKENLMKIISESKTQREVLNKLGLGIAGSNFSTLRKFIKLYDISTEHFTKNYSKMLMLKTKIPLSEILIEKSTFSRGHLKDRLYNDGILKRECCLCGQDENWNGMKIALILDHINGVCDDNRLQNLRIVCPNCNAGLDTFAGRNLKKRNICKCGLKKDRKSEICSKCYGQKRRKVERPNIEDLKKEIEDFGYSATSRKYGVSDNAVRKWLNKNQKIINSSPTSITFIS